jgi:peroxiredoxin
VVINAKLKSLYILPATAITVALLLISLVQAVVTEHAQTAWLGAAIASLPMPFVIGWLMLRPVERTTDNLPFLVAIGAIGVLVSVFEQFVEGSAGRGPTSVALVSATLFYIYVFWFSRFGRVQNANFSVGSKMPEFALSDADGNNFHSSELVGSPAVLMFYRGNWCPLCVAQIRELAGRYQDLEAMGIKVVLISPQPDEQSRKLAAMHDVPFRFLVDAGNKLARSLEIAVSNGVPIGLPGGYAADTVLPTLIVTNAAGTIVFSDQTDNYRVRPEPDVFLAILRRSGVVAQ